MYDYYDYGSAYGAGDEAFIIVLLVLGLAFMIGLFIGWLITLYPRYYMIKASGVGPAWSAFIPFWQDYQLFKIAGWQGWYYWIYLGAILLTSWIPIIRYLVLIAVRVFLAITFYRISDNFGLGTVGKVLSIFFGFFVYWYVALTKKPYMNKYVLNAYQGQDSNWYKTDNTQQNSNWYQQTPPQQPPTQQNQSWYQNNQNQ